MNTTVSYKNAVRVCQLQMKLNELIGYGYLAIDGYVGESTVRVLNAIASDVSNKNIIIQLYTPEWKDSVKYLQEWYHFYSKKAGIKSIDIDNEYGIDTHNTFMDLIDDHNHLPTSRKSCVKGI